MRAVAMSFSLFQFPRCRILSLANSWQRSIENGSRTGASCCNFKFLDLSRYGLEGKHTRGWIGLPMSTRSEGSGQSSSGRKTTNIRREVSDVTIARSVNLNINKSEVKEFEQIQYRDIQQKIADTKAIAELLTIIVFDIETTGFSRQNERIIEIALLDLAGGENSTFQTLVNPERYVPNQHIHGISSNMVNRSDVPTMKDLIPLLLEYVKSRQKPGGEVMFVAHNARTFDVPFLIEEFARCSYDLPQNWRYLDGIRLANELKKSGGPNQPSKISLQSLREHYKIPLIGSAHRAMSDVQTLALVLQRMTFDLKIPLPGLVERSFKASELIKPKKKKG